MKLIKFSKIDLDRYSTILGFILGLLGILISRGLVDPEWGGTVFAILTFSQGYLINKPANKHPTTEDLEK